MAKELDTFLDGEDAEPRDDATPEEHAHVEAKAPEPEPQAKDAKAPEPAEPEAAEEHDEPEVPEDVAGLRKAIQSERAKRNDHKGRADRLAGEIKAMKAELEAARKATEAKAAPAAQAVAAPQPVAIPNPIEDPQGYHAYQERQRFSDKCDISEDRLREQIGDDADVDAKVERFKQMAANNPKLGDELRAHRHPYRFAYDTAKKAMALEEIGDPQSFREKTREELRAEVRAEMEAELGGTQRPSQPRVALPQSLGTARSASPRNVGLLNIPEDFADILASPRR